MKNDDNPWQTPEIYVIESFRYPTKKWQWELPSGGIEPGASLLETAKNELAEELGITADKWTHISRNVPAHNGLMRDATDVFVAEGLHTGKEHREESEAIRDVKAIPFEGVITMINDGRLADGQTLAALMQFVAWRKML